MPPRQLGSASGAPHALAAAGLYRESLSVDARNPKTWYDLALALNKLGDKAGEQQALEKAVMLDPVFTLAHNQLGVRYTADGKVGEAEKEFQAALGIEPQFAEARNNLGVLYGRQGRNADAEKMLRQAIEDSPEYVQAYVNLSLILAAQGQFTEAERQTQAAIRLAPDDHNAQTALRMIRTQMAGGAR